MVHLYILPVKVAPRYKKVSRIRRGIKMHIYPILVRTHKGLTPLIKHPTFEKVRDTKITYLSKLGRRCGYIHPTPLLALAIKFYLERAQAKEIPDVSCYRFACWASGIALTKGDEWLYEPKPYRMKCGDVVFLFRNNGTFDHAAVYLGRGMYIGVYGAGGELTVQTYHDLRRNTKGRRIVLARLIKNA